MVLTLLSAVYDPAAATLTYEVQLLQGDEVKGLTLAPEMQKVFDEPRTYAESSLFIDNVLVGAALDSSCSNGDCTDSCCAPGCQAELIDCASYGYGVSGFWNCVC